VTIETQPSAKPPESSINIPSYEPHSAGRFPTDSLFKDAILPEDSQELPPEVSQKPKVDVRRLLMMVFLSAAIFGALFLFLTVDPDSEENFIDTLMSDISAIFGDNSFDEEMFLDSPQPLNNVSQGQPSGDAGFFDSQPSAEPKPIEGDKPGSLADVLGESTSNEANLSTKASGEGSMGQMQDLPTQPNKETPEALKVGEATNLLEDLPSPENSSIEATEVTTLEEGLIIPEAESSGSFFENRELTLYSVEPSPAYVLDVLDKINAWLNGLPHDQSELRSFLLHRKAWARLGALGYSVEKSAIPKEEILEAANLLKRDFNRGRIRRFLRRYKFDKPEVYQEMKKLLWN